MTKRFDITAFRWRLPDSGDPYEEMISLERGTLIAYAAGDFGIDACRISFTNASTDESRYYEQHFGGKHVDFEVDIVKDEQRQTCRGTGFMPGNVIRGFAPPHAFTSNVPLLECLEYLRGRE